MTARIATRAVLILMARITAGPDSSSSDMSVSSTFGMVSGVVHMRTAARPDVVDHSMRASGMSSARDRSRKASANRSLSSSPMVTIGRIASAVSVFLVSLALVASLYAAAVFVSPVMAWLSPRRAQRHVRPRIFTVAPLGSPRRTVL